MCKKVIVHTLDGIFSIVHFRRMQVPLGFQGPGLRERVREGPIRYRLRLPVQLRAGQVGRMRSGVREMHLQTWLQR